MTLAAILRQKGREVASVSPKTIISEVANLLAQRRIGAVLVCDSAMQILGVLSERDIVRALATHGAATLEFTAAQLMSSPVHSTHPETTVAAALGMMTAKRIRHLPVIDDEDNLAGLVSIGDVVKAMIDQQKVEVESLTAYVTGSA